MCKSDVLRPPFSNIVTQEKESSLKHVPHPNLWKFLRKQISTGFHTHIHIGNTKKNILAMHDK